MKKIGIVTMVGVDNYGNLLQNYAVKKLIEDSGFKAVTLNNNISESVKVNEVKTKDKLKPSYILSYIKVVLFKKFGCKNSKDLTPQGILSRIFSFKKYSAKKRNRTKKLATFRNDFLPFDSALVNSEAFHQEKYFAFVCGSDVVWYPKNRYDKSNDFLAFAPKYKRIALAPSFGVSKIPEGRIDDYKKWIEGIEHLSVRENTGAQIIKELTDRDAEVLSDPTLSIDVESWRDIQQVPKDEPKEDFVFCYFLGNRTKNYEKFIIQYAKEHHCKIINVLDAADLDHYDVGLGEFLWFIDNAKAVFTDSFHGVVFSAIFHSLFVAFKRVERGLELFSRISSFLSDIKLENRVYPLIASEEIGNIDFDFSDEVIEKKRKLTKKFLSKSISTIEANIKDEPEEQLKQETVLKNKEDCCGCYACFNACPKKCISMDKDSEGFWYPHINLQECICCNKCQKVCPALNSSSNTNKPMAYLGFNNNPYVRENSSSGGIFTAIAEKIIDMDGAVFGCGFNDIFEVEHICVETKEEVEKLQGSKYVQSRIGDTYSRVKEFLSKGRTVLFTGTPCQIEGLLSFLGDIDISNLYTQDIICHGVPSPGVWKEYLEYRSKGNEINSVSFRDKKYGWHYFSMNIETDKKRYTKRLDEDLFLRLFLNNTILRPSCYNCKFKKEVRISDFTLADCWRPESVKSQLKDDDKGLSMFFVNTEKAKAFFEIIKKNYTIQEIDYDLAINSQKVATSSVKPNIYRQEFFDEFKNKGLKYIDKNRYRLNMMQRMKKRLIYYKTRLAKKCGR